MTQIALALVLLNMAWTAVPESLPRLAGLAVLLAFFGGIIGVLLAFGATMIGRFLEFPAEVPMWAVALGLTVSSGIGLMAGIYPAWRASRLDPAVALRLE